MCAVCRRLCMSADEHAFKETHGKCIYQETSALSVCEVEGVLRRLHERCGETPADPPDHSFNPLH